MTDKIEYEIIDASCALVSNFVSVEQYFATFKTNTDFLLSGSSDYPAICFIDVTASPAIVHLISAAKVFNAMRKNVEPLSSILEGASKMEEQDVYLEPPLDYNPNNGSVMDIEISAAEYRLTENTWYYNPWTGIARTDTAVQMDPLGTRVKYRREK